MSNSNNSNRVGITAEQAAQALLAEGFLFDFDYAGQGIALHNDEDKMLNIREGCILLDRFYGEFEVLSKHPLAQCRIEEGKLVLGPAVSKQILE